MTGLVDKWGRRVISLEVGVQENGVNYSFDGCNFKLKNIDTGEMQSVAVEGTAQLERIRIFGPNEPLP